MRQPAPPPTFSRLGRSRPPRDAISYGKPVYVFCTTHTLKFHPTTALRRSASVVVARTGPRSLLPSRHLSARGAPGGRRCGAPPPPRSPRRSTFSCFRPAFRAASTGRTAPRARAIACARTSLRTCTARTPPRTFWRTPCATTWRIPTRPNPSSRPYTAPRASASLTSTSSSRRRCTTPSTTTTGRATRDSPLRLRATPTPTRVRPRPATRSADSARGATRRSTRRRPSRSTPPQRLARVDSVGAPARTAPRTRSSSARITSRASARRRRGDSATPSWTTSRDSPSRSSSSKSTTRCPAPPEACSNNSSTRVPTRTPRFTAPSSSWRRTWASRRSKENSTSASARGRRKVIATLGQPPRRRPRPRR